jgi:flagellar hook assembly protein FlgD
VSGQLVSVLDESPRSAGRFTVGWNGQDLQGRLVASGTYYVHVEMEEWSVTRRVLLLRN